MAVLRLIKKIKEKIKKIYIYWKLTLFILRV